MQPRVRFLRQPVDPARKAASLEMLRAALNRIGPFQPTERDHSKCQLFSYPGEYELSRDNRD